MTRRTKIVATIGPASDSEETLRQLILAGVDVCRLGLAHGTIEEHQDRIKRIRKVAAEIGRPISILGDLPGPKIRMGPVIEEGGLFLAEGQRIEIRPGDAPTAPDHIHVDYDHLLEAVDVGDSLVLGDGSVRLVAVENDGSKLIVEVEHGGRIQGRPGVTLPSAKLRVSVPTEQDIALLAGLADQLDFVAASFVRSAGEVAAVKALAKGADVVAKIETKAAVDALDAIINVSDAVMVARGDLGNECDIAEVPHLQKQIIRQGVSFGVPVITATQMLESMVSAPSPTRAETSDIANAVFDGSSAVMLSGETAIGHDPTLAVGPMARIAERADEEFDYDLWAAKVSRLNAAQRETPDDVVTNSMTNAAWKAAIESGAKSIICVTRTGFTVRSIARYRPNVPILGFSTDPRTLRQLTLSWGATPVALPGPFDITRQVSQAIGIARAEGHVRSGDLVAVLSGSPDYKGVATDSLRLVHI